MDGPQVKRLYYSLSDVCRMTHLKPHVIKAWEKAYGRIRPLRGKGGRLLFRPRDVNLIRMIKKFRTRGYSEDTVRDLLRNPGLESMETTTLLHDKGEEPSVLIHQITVGLEEILSILEEH